MKHRFIAGSSKCTTKQLSNLLTKILTVIKTGLEKYCSIKTSHTGVNNMWILKGQLQRFYKLVSYERAVKILKNDICITEIGQAVLEIFEFKVEFPRKIPKIRNFANVSIIRVEQ